MVLPGSSATMRGMAKYFLMAHSESDLVPLGRSYGSKREARWEAADRMRNDLSLLFVTMLKYDKPAKRAKTLRRKIADAPSRTGGQYDLSFVETIFRRDLRI
jgi:hypothetical protein